MSYQFDFSFLYDYWPDLLAGMRLTIGLSVLSILFGFIFGSACAIARVHGGKTMRTIVGCYVDLVRNTPLVVQAFWLFFGMASMGLKIGAFWAAIITLVINVGAYTTEIIRAGLESIPRGQKEAADCLALRKWQVILYIELPQAVERVYPALVSQFILMMLATSIMSQISVEELTGAAYGIQSMTFRGFEVYVVVAVIYLVLSWLTRTMFEVIARIAFTRRRRLRTPL
ncbi:amino acid ABC transporter permease [Paenirhodobacter populi]|uniref:amino acid ABC transporter permease n=1 Tax=Paenirhodobacter populi TaxID=2306993 RepID=UPI000FE3B997|nr:amino acid ABC transporter permease [Sinirhodobacter populi]RWR05340.1 amino acid ABC transporter permease [Sinirhodobacter populi]